MKTRLFIIFLLPTFFLGIPAFTQEPVSAVAGIEAEEFVVKPLKKSSSGKVILFEDPTLNDPRPGKILLLKNGEEDLAAIRVLKNYPGKFAAKILLKFKDIPSEPVELRSLKKLSNKMLRQIRDQERAPLDPTLTDDELAKEIAPSDIELDRGIPTPQKKLPPKAKVIKKEEAPETLEISEESLTDESADFSRTEEAFFERYNHILSLQLGFLYNVDATNARYRYNGIGLRYGFNFARRIIFNQSGRQDMLTLEAGAYYFTISPYEGLDDTVTVYPLEAVLRYTFMPNDSLQFFIYAGIMKSFVQASETVTEAGAALLTRSQLAIGGGMIIPIGPGWALRGDAGKEKIVFGISLRF